ncbi:hypothetical protein LSCM1_05916 [Leishmania martiniquensis]|uniref:Uncharacterized protein n=1 Tax=Leishmania martiniquensis TaxID=1580590 RepID=A0A836GL85_9TRYP|nr:hypothetical protein LSCM1_05916 [Leishmania martiniquensis]
MHHASLLRDAALLTLFGLLLLVGIVQDSIFDDAESSHAGEVHELRYEEHSLWTLLFTSRAQWRAAPLALSRHEFPYVTNAFVTEYINRTGAPQLSDVRDARTIASNDFFEQVQMLRRPGSGAAQMAMLVDAVRQSERVAARAEAARNRHHKSWKVRRPATSLLRFLGGQGSVDGGDRCNEEDGAASGDVVEVCYPRNLTLHHRGSSTSPPLASDDVQLVPYPWVPLPLTAQHEGATAEKAHTGECADTRMAAADRVGIANGTGPAIKVSIPKGRLRSAVAHRATPHTPTHGWDHFYIAMNLWKSEEVLPDLTEALIVFLEEEVEPFFDLATSVVVSIYATISPDRTADLILTVLIPRLHAAGVRRVYATTEGSCLGYVERQPFHERTEWMACIRNKALAPLYEKGMNAFERSPRQEQDSADSGADSLVVLFFNDIFFRPQDITALLESRAESQMAATTRPHGWMSSASKTSREKAGASAASIHDDGHAQQRQRDTAPISPSGATSTMTATSFDMACGMDFYLTFYDTWVARDRLGKCFEGVMPYSDDHATQDAFYRIFRGTHHGNRASETASIPVKCCWNGVAAIRGRFFLTPTRPVTTSDTRRSATDAAAASSPDVALHPSGAVYDRIGDVRDLLAKTALSRYYTRVLARRLMSKCKLWSKTRSEIAALTDVPFYEPEVCSNSHSFESLLHGVEDHEVRQPSAASEDWTQLRLRIENLTLLLATAPDLARRIDAASKAGGSSGMSSAAPATLRAEEDSTYYRARYPSLRFRHAFTPSYGATVSGQTQVRDGVCLASECLLICQDVAHATLLQERRAPIILLNPHVRVAYSADDFNRVIGHRWFFANPYVYWGWTLARRLQLCWPFSVLTRGISATLSSLRELGEATSAMDDWLQSASVAAPSRPVMGTVQEVRVQDGDGRVRATGFIDIPTLTRMECVRTSGAWIVLELAFYLPLLRLGQLLFAALLLCWLGWQVKADVVVAPTLGGGAGQAGSVKVQWWRALHRALGHPQPAGRPGWRAGGVVSEESEKETAVSGGGGYGRLLHPLPHLATLLLPLSRLKPHFTKTCAAHPCGGQALRAMCVFAQSLMRLPRTLCCARLWHGCRPARRPFSNLPGWWSSMLRELSSLRSSASPAKPCHRSAPSPAVEVRDAYGGGNAAVEEASGYAAALRTEGMPRSVSWSTSIPRSVAVSGGNDTQVQWRRHDTPLGTAGGRSSNAANAAECLTELHHQLRSRNSNCASRSPLPFGDIP